MPVLDLVYAPNPIFKQKSALVETIDAEVKSLVADLYETLYEQRGLGLAATMVGILKQIVVIDLQDDEIKAPITMINPVITSYSDDTQTFEEASLCYPGIGADITRPKSIEVTFLDINGKEQKLSAEGWLSQVIQHEVDYLEGKVYLDFLKPMKRQLVMKKMQKFKRNIDRNEHVHGEGCGC